MYVSFLGSLQLGEVSDQMFAGLLPLIPSTSYVGPRPGSSREKPGKHTRGRVVWVHTLQKVTESSQLVESV